MRITTGRGGSVGGNIIGCEILCGIFIVMTWGHHVHTSVLVSPPHHVVAVGSRGEHLLVDNNLRSLFWVEPSSMIFRTLTISSLDEEEENLPYSAMYDDHLMGDDFADGRRRGRYTYVLHPTARCLGAWRKPNWWSKSSLPAVIPNITASLDKGAKTELDRVWRQIRNGEDPAAATTAPSSRGGGSSSSASRGVLSAAQFASFQQALTAANTNSRPDLLRMLKQNDIQGMSTGNKSLLAETVAILKTLGVPKACPKCGRGQVDFDWKTGQVTCRGYKVGMAGWKHCLGPAAQGVAWSQLARVAWKEGLAPPPQPKAKAKPYKPYGGYGGFGGGFYDDYDPFDYY